MTSSWFGHDAIIVAYLLKLTFEFTSIVKGNKLRTRVLRQPAVMELILNRGSQSIIGFNNLKPSCGWIYHSECKQRVLSGVFIVKGPARSAQTMNQRSDSAVLEGGKPYFLRSFFCQLKNLFQYSFSSNFLLSCIIYLTSKHSQ
jgi:hypothetical protein